MAKKKVSKKKVMDHCKCHCGGEFRRWFALAILLLGVWYMLADYGYSMIRLNWWSAVFLLVGIKMVFIHWFE